MAGTPILGRVAKILDEYTLIINVGGEQGVQPGMLFAVYTEGGEVMDPETGKSLGRWEVVKARVMAQHVQERMTVCAAKSQEELRTMAMDPRTHVLSGDMIAASMGQYPGSGDRPRLDVKRSDISGMPIISPIAVGERVRSVT